MVSAEFDVAARHISRELRVSSSVLDVIEMYRRWSQQVHFVVGHVDCWLVCKQDFTAQTEEAEMSFDERLRSKRMCDCDGAGLMSMPNTMDCQGGRINEHGFVGGGKMVTKVVTYLYCINRQDPRLSMPVLYDHYCMCTPCQRWEDRLSTCISIYFDVS
jgi:hypothetical protein